MLRDLSGIRSGVVLGAAVQAGDDDVGAGPARPGGVGQDPVDVQLGRVEVVDRPLPPMRFRDAIQPECPRKLGDARSTDVGDVRGQALRRRAEGAGVAHAARVEGVQGAHKPVEAGIERVVRRGRAGVVARAGERVDDLRLHAEARIAAEGPVGIGEWGFQMTDRQIGSLDHRGDVGEHSAEVEFGTVGPAGRGSSSDQRRLLMQQHVTSRHHRQRLQS